MPVMAVESARCAVAARRRATFAASTRARSRRLTGMTWVKPAQAPALKRCMNIGSGVKATAARRRASATPAHGLPSLKETNVPPPKMAERSHLNLSRMPTLPPFECCAPLLEMRRIATSETTERSRARRTGLCPGASSRLPRRPHRSQVARRHAGGWVYDGVQEGRRPSALLLRVRQVRTLALRLGPSDPRHLTPVLPVLRPGGEAVPPTARRQSILVPPWSSITEPGYTKHGPMER